jgi:Protein of unknown function (DUF3105)
VRTRILLLAIGLIAAAPLSGCGGSGSDTTGSSGPTSGPSPANPSTEPSENGSSHLNPSSGITNGVPLDDRAGTPPPALAVTNLKQAAKETGCDLRLHLKDEGHQHVTGSVTYGTNPPTSGNHNPVPQADGAYLGMPPTTSFVHSLEHGRLEIQYSPDLSEEQQLELKGLYDSEYSGALLFPNADMPYEVAATTWTNLLGCKTYRGAITLDAIRDFGVQTWGRFGGEPVDAFGPLTGPTPAQPSS